MRVRWRRRGRGGVYWVILKSRDLLRLVERDLMGLRDGVCWIGVLLVALGMKVLRRVRGKVEVDMIPAFTYEIVD